MILSERLKVYRGRLEHLGPTVVREQLRDGRITIDYRDFTISWLAEKDKEAEARAASSHTEMAATASRAAEAAERAATTAEAQARTAKYALITAIAATIIAAAALIVSIIGFFHFFGR